MLRTTTTDIDELKAQIEQLTARIAKSDPSISVEKIDVKGDVTGNIVVGNRNVIGDNNVIYEVNTVFGAFIKPRKAPPAIKKRPPGPAPHAPRRFVGRQGKLEQLEDHIRRRDPALLHGRSGVGKTTLLQQVANSEAAKSMPDGVIYLEPLYEGNKLSFQDLLQRLFDRLFVSNPRIKLSDPTSQAGLARDSSILDLLKHLFPKWFGATSEINVDDSLIEANLATTSPLILLDEMGIKQEALNRLSRLFPAGAVLATSQNKPSDDVYEPIEVGLLSSEEAVQLFAEKSGITIDDTTRPVMEEVCGVLEYTPLAIATVANGIRQGRIRLDNEWGLRQALGALTLKDGTADDSIEWKWLSPEEAVQLFAEKSGIAIDDTTRPVMEQVCRVLSGGPPEIAVVANSIRLKGISLDTLKGLHLLVHMLKGIDHPPPGIDSIQFAIMRSFILLHTTLTDQHRQYLELLAMVPGSFDLKLLQKNPSLLKDVIGDLKDLELVYANSPRMRLPETLRELLPTSPPKPEMPDWKFVPSELKLDDYLLKINSENRYEWLVLSLLSGLEQPEEALEFVAAELSNILYMLEWSFDQKHWSHVIKLGRAIDPYLTLNGLWDVWETVLKRVEVAARNGEDAAARAWALHQLGTREIGVGGRARAIDLLKRALELRLRTGDIQAATYTLHNLHVLWLLPPPSPKPGPEPPDPPVPNPQPGLISLSTPLANVLVGFVVILGLVTGLLLQPSLKFTPRAVSERYSINDQEIEYEYEIDNAGFVPIPGPIIVTDDRVNVVCPDLQVIGNGDTSLDWNETMPCWGVYLITDDDVKRGSVSSHVSVSTTGKNGKAGIQSKPRSIEVPLDTNSLTMLVEAQPGEFEQAGETITIAYIVKNDGTASLNGPIQIHADEGLSVNCSDRPQSDDPDILGIGESRTCTATITTTDTDVKRGSITSTVRASAGRTDSRPQTVTIYAVQPPDPPKPDVPPSDPTQPDTTPSGPTETDTPSSDPSQTDAPPSGPTQPDAAPSDPAQPDTPSSDPSQTDAPPSGPTQPDTTPSGPTETDAPPSGPSQPDPSQPDLMQSGLTLSTSTAHTIYKAAGEQIQFIYSIANQGNNPLRGPVSVTAQGVNIVCPQLAEVGNRDDLLDPGESLKCLGIHVIDQADIDRRSLTSRAIASTGGLRAVSRSITLFFETPPPLLFKLADRKTYRAAGDVIPYTFVVMNSGSALLAGPVRIKDDMVEVKCPEVGQGVEPGQSITCTAVYRTTEEDVRRGSVTNTAVAYIGRSTSKPQSFTVYLQTEPSNLALIIHADPETYREPGQEIQYTYFVTNDGRYPLRGPLAVRDNKAAVSCPDVNTTGDGDGALDPDERLVCSAVYTITEADMQNGSITNSARASMDGVSSNPDAVTVTASALDLAITTDRQSYETVGNTIRYEYVITGRSKAPLPGRLSLDHQNDQIEIDCPAVNSVGNGDDFLDWNESLTCTGEHPVTQADIDIARPGSNRGAVTTSARASIGGVTSRQARVEVTGPVQQPALSLAMTADTSRFDSVDQKITLTYVITNTGNVTISAPMQITDDHIDRGAPFPCGDTARGLAPNESMTCTRSYAITQEDFGPKSVTNSATVSSIAMNLPISSSTVTATVSCQYREGWIPYTVDPNETWEHILSWYPDMTPAEIQKANCLGSASSVATGQILHVPRQPPLAAISGVMRDSTGQPLRNTPIVLTNTTSGTSTTAYTGVTGEFTFLDLEPGTYRIFQVMITVRRGDTKTQNFTIVAGTP